MFRLQRLLILCAGSMTFIAGCGVTSYDSTSGAASVSSAPAGGTGTSGGSGSGSSGTGGFSGSSSGTLDHDHIVATPAIAGMISVEVGMPQTVSVTFNSSDGRVITGFALTDTLSKLPVGWTGPASFGCATVSTGSGCVLNLTYAPPAYDAGEMLTLTYEYVDNDLESITAGANTSTSLPYRATTNDNIAGAISPSGQVNSVVAAAATGSQSVTITYNTDDGFPASGLSITTDLTALPAGWSSSVSSLSCAMVSTGNGCQLLLTYTPTQYGMGNLVIDYAYSDDSGTAKVGANNIPYAATTHDTVVATPSPSGQIVAVVPTGGQAVDVAFTTSDNAPAGGFHVTTDLTALPAGWSSSSTSFSCAGVGAGSSCHLPLLYAPTAVGSGMLMIAYSYVDDAGTANSGSINIPYQSTSNNNVGASFNPSGLGVSSGSSTPVTLTFATDDGAPASGLSVTSGLAMLPSGWSAPATWTCSTVDAGTPCILSLSYAPTAADSGTLTFGYAYSSGSGVTKTGTAQLNYSATP